MGGTASRHKGRGSSKQSQLETADRPAPPGKPQLVPGTPNSEPDVVTISWEPSQYDGGTKVVGYLVEHRRTGSPHWVRSSPVLVRQPQLTLSGLEPGWRYQFRVSAKNAVGYSEPGELSELLTVTLQRAAASAPHFVKELQDSVALENEKAELSVQVTGTPPPTIAWYKDGLEIYSSRRQKILTENDTSTLLIYQAALSDEGEVKCTATNRVGHAVTKAKLRLEAPPSIRLPRQYEEGLIFEKDEVIRLRVAVVGRPAPEVFWIHNSELLPQRGRYEISHSEKHATLRVGEARRTDRGEYQVRAVNRLGEDVASFLVTVTDRPMPPGKAKVVMTLGRSVTLSWTAPDDDGGCKIGNYIVEYYRIGWNMWLKAATCRQLTTTLGDLIEGSEYKFRVKAENPYGVSDPSEDSDVVFIPDPKRGLLEPPERSAISVNNNQTIENWLNDHKRPLEAPSSVANDDLYSVRKNKKKRVISPPTTSTNNQEFSLVVGQIKVPAYGLTTNQENTPCPSVPKRKPKVDKKVNKEMNPLVEQKVNEITADKNEKILEVSEKKWDKQIPRNEDNIIHGSSEMMLVLLPDSRAATEERDFLRKSELFSNLEDNEAVAPPMSLSAPELGYEEPLEFPPLRSAVSSSEILHERTMQRFYQDMAEEESKAVVLRRKSFERRRSFERRSLSIGKDVVLPSFKTVSSEELRTSFKDEGNELEKHNKEGNKKVKQSEAVAAETNKSFTKVPDVKDSLDSILEYPNREKLLPQNSEEDMEYDNESMDEEEYDEEDELTEAEEMIDEELNEELEEEEEIEDYIDDEDEEELDNILTESEEDLMRLEPINEDTYHPRNMIPKTSNIKQIKIVNDVEETEPLNFRQWTKTVKKGLQPPPVPEHKIAEIITFDVKHDARVNFKNYNTILSLNTQHLTKDSNESIKPVVEVCDTSEGKHVPNAGRTTPKPILKIRDHSLERLPEQSNNKRNSHSAPIALVEAELNIVSKAKNDDEIETNTGKVKLKKKTVRIEDPKGKVSESEESIENHINISAAEFAQNRRRRSGSLAEDPDPQKIVISHYSDIVAEYGKTKRPSTPKYLNFEELRAAAESVESTLSNQDEKCKVPTEEENTQPFEYIKPIIDQVHNVEDTCTTPVVRQYTVTEKKVRSFIDFLMDFVLFLFACWLYTFKDERLAIPVILLMIYRQAFEGIRKRLPRRWRRQ